ncbi:MAG: tRNA (adenosine(37)-N6)-dimethylallyltransferase MiaA [Casimicrobiaceae bacterium]
MRPALPLLLLMGPTAAGKSTVALALAARVGGEIVSVDSAQIYRGMDIGTAKPSTAERAQVAHHLIDIVDPDARYSAARFVDDATRAIADLRARGHVPILTGGTMLYFKALREGLSTLPAADAALRAAIDARAAEQGWAAVHAQLAAVDPVSAARLDPHDSQRVQRALEVWTLTGTPLSALQGRRLGRAPALGRIVSVALLPSDRARLHRAIADRFERMLADGLLAEVAALRVRHVLTSDLPSMRSVGYRQAWQHLEGQLDAGEMRMRALAATRQLAKRQFTWLRATEAIALDPSTMSVDAQVARIVAALDTDRAESLR